MLHFFDPLRQFDFLSIFCRLALALACAGLIGYGRSKRHSGAGLRTYMLVALGGALSILITQYEYSMLHSVWAETLAQVGEKFDASRLSSQVLTGIGFLGAGIILKVAHHQVIGLTTATGLFATACMSIAAGAGFFECVILTMILIIVVLNIMDPLELMYKRRLHHITLHVEMENMDALSRISDAIEQQNAMIFEVEIESGPEPASAVFILKMSRENSSHSAMLSTIAELDCVNYVQELIS